ncbi:MAG: hypothetical protein P9M07_03150 [Candidatus Aceula meridiana]|nr:hypothetical protein [Candidatus Aceula meridiana]
MKRARCFIVFLLLGCFLTQTVLPIQVFAQGVGLLGLPTAGSSVSLSPAFTPTLVRGIRVYPDNPFQFDFIVDSGDTGLQGDDLKKESEKLIRYFLASLTLPENDLWVNLSPYERDRIVPDALGSTEMGRDMLAQDYLLKQITASLTNPDSDLGKEFWSKIYKKAYEKYGTTDIPVDTFNKVWIMPDKAEVYVKDDRAFVVESKLKVMLEEDYVALTHSRDPKNNEFQKPNSEKPNSFASQIVREIIIPALKKEVNEGKNFAQLRQIYNSIILSYWYKTNLKDSILNKVYSDQKKVKGIDLSNKDATEKIYAQYLKTFKKGVFDMIKVEYDPYTKVTVPRKYFAGGVTVMDLGNVFNNMAKPTQLVYEYANSSKKNATTYVVAFKVESPEYAQDVTEIPVFDNAMSASASSTLTVGQAKKELKEFMLLVDEFRGNKNDPDRLILIENVLATKTDFKGMVATIEQIFREFPPTMEAYMKIMLTRTNGDENILRFIVKAIGNLPEIPFDQELFHELKPGEWDNIFLKMQDCSKKLTELQENVEKMIRREESTDPLTENYNIIYEIDNPSAINSLPHYKKPNKKGLDLPYPYIESLNEVEMPQLFQSITIEQVKEKLKTFMLLIDEIQGVKSVDSEKRINAVMAKVADIDGIIKIIKEISEGLPFFQEQYSSFAMGDFTDLQVLKVVNKLSDTLPSFDSTSDFSPERIDEMFSKIEIYSKGLKELQLEANRIAKKVAGSQTTVATKIDQSYLQLDEFRPTSCSFERGPLGVMLQLKIDKKSSVLSLWRDEKDLVNVLFDGKIHKIPQSGSLEINFIKIIDSGANSIILRSDPQQGQDEVFLKRDAFLRKDFFANGAVILRSTKNDSEESRIDNVELYVDKNLTIGDANFSFSMDSSGDIHISAQDSSKPGSFWLKVILKEKIFKTDREILEESPIAFLSSNFDNYCQILSRLGRNDMSNAAFNFIAALLADRRDLFREIFKKDFSEDLQWKAKKILEISAQRKEGFAVNTINVASDFSDDPNFYEMLRSLQSLRFKESGFREDLNLEENEVRELVFAQIADSEEVFKITRYFIEKNSAGRLVVRDEKNAKVIDGYHFRIIQTEAAKPKIAFSSTVEGFSVTNYDKNGFLFFTINPSDKAMKNLINNDFSNGIGDTQISSSNIDSKSDVVGGIDFNAKNMNVESTGSSSVQFNLPEGMTVEGFRNIQGLVPVIISIIPVTDFYRLLGLNRENKPKDQQRQSKSYEELQPLALLEERHG